MRQVAGIRAAELAIRSGDKARVTRAGYDTQPRQPCFKRGLRFADNTFGRIMMQTRRTGWYARVLRAGALKAGDAIHIVRRPNPEWTIDRFNQAVLMRSATVDELKELSRIGGWRKDGEKESCKTWTTSRKAERP